MDTPQPAAQPPVTPPPTIKRLKPWQRERWAWRVSILSAVLVGLFITVGVVTEDMSHGGSSVSGFAGVAVILIYFLSPGFVSAKATHSYFWYGLLPVMLTIIVGPLLFIPLLMIAESFGVRSTTPTSHLSDARILKDILYSGLIAWLVTSGTVSLIRYSRTISKQRAAKRVADLEAQMNIEIEGSWPPKPRTHSSDEYLHP